jgi:hypothetical protein
MRIRKKTLPNLWRRTFQAAPYPDYCLNFLNFPSIFKINQFVGQSETWDRRFESKSRTVAFRRVHK